MNAFAFRSSRIFSAFAVIAATGALFVTTGCGSKNKAAAAQTPPPQTLSEPVRPGESTPSASPSIPVATTGETYSVSKGESRELPQFVEPAAPPMPRAPVVSSAPARVVEPMPASSVAGGSRVHTMAKGDTLYGISRQYKVPVKDLLAANNFKDPNRLSVGTKVYIP